MNNTRKDKELSVGDHFTFSANHSESASGFKDCCMSTFLVSVQRLRQHEKIQDIKIKICEVQLREKHRSASGAEQPPAYIQAGNPLFVWQPHLKGLGIPVDTGD